MAWLIDRAEWLRIYESIKRRLPLNFAADQLAADVLSGLLSSHRGALPLEGLPRLGGLVVVFGCGPGLDEAVEVYVRKHGGLPALAADGAARHLLDAGVVPALVVTDLDGDARAIREAGELGSVLVVHAHGDNVGRLREVVPSLKGGLVGSTQVEPRPFVHNFGGFTDGDRALFVARALGARGALLGGFDFERPGSCRGSRPKDPALKAAKLSVARELVAYLEARGFWVGRLA